jgi:hypothetical protein
MAIKKSDPPSKKKLSQMDKLEAAMIKSGFYNPKAPPKFGVEITRTTKTAPNKKIQSVLNAVNYPTRKRISGGLQDGKMMIRKDHSYITKTSKKK